VNIKGYINNVNAGCFRNREKDEAHASFSYNMEDLMKSANTTSNRIAHYEFRVPGTVVTNRNMSRTFSFIKSVRDGKVAALNLRDRNAMPFIPLFAEEGEKLESAGRGQRGGLLNVDSSGENMLQNMAQALGRGGASFDSSIIVDVFKRLEQSDLFTKEDIKQYDLLYRSCHPKSKAIFEYLVNWDPTALKEHEFESNQFLLASTANVGTSWWSNDSFAMALKAGMKHYPEELGFLFKKDINVHTACMLVLDRYGEEEAWGVIEKCLDETRHVKMIKMNPMTNLYPFMLAAGGDEAGDLNTLYYLLRWSPEVLYGVRQEDRLDYGLWC